MTGKNQLSKYYIADEIAAVQDLHADILNSSITQTDTLLDRQAHRLKEGFILKDPAVLFNLICWSPEYRGWSRQDVLATAVPTLEICQLTMAREYGYTDWQDVIANSAELDQQFEDVVDAVVTGDIETVEISLKNNSALATKQSQFGHGATLLHYLGANGVESHRQTTPYNAKDIAQLIIEHGGNKDAMAKMYGGSTPRVLMETSAHTHNSGVLEDLLTLF
jgi:hypothetical protein